MPDHIAASVSEPVRAKRPTLYGLLRPTELEDAQRGAYASVTLRITKPSMPPAGWLEITIPGDDPAPTGWRPASEPDPLPWKVRHQNSRDIVAAFAWADQANAYRERGAACGGWHESELEVVNPTPPGAKK